MVIAAAAAVTVATQLDRLTGTAQSTSDTQAAAPADPGDEVTVHYRGTRSYLDNIIVYADLVK